MFKPSKSNNGVWNLIKTIWHTAIFWTIFLYLLPMGIVKIEVAESVASFQFFEGFAWALFIFFSSIGIYSGYTMSLEGKGTPLPLDCPNELVVKGPYKIVRNPMAIAGIGQGICVGLILGSYSVILYSIFGGVLWHFIVRPIEEKDLEARFGKSYLEYKKEIKCWISKLK